MLFLLLKIILILFIGYVTMICLYRLTHQVSLDDAQKVVDTLIKEGINTYFFRNQTVSQEPNPDNTFLDKIRDILQEHNELKKSSLKPQFKPNFYGFPMVTFDIVASDDTMFDLLRIQLEEEANCYLMEYFLDALVYVYFEKHGDFQYYVCICYAVYEPAKTALRKFIDNRIAIDRKQAIQRISPVVNAQLEQELAAMKKGDGNV